MDDIERLRYLAGLKDIGKNINPKNINTFPEHAEHAEHAERAEESQPRKSAMTTTLKRISTTVALREGIPFPKLEGYKWVVAGSAGALTALVTADAAVTLYGPVIGGIAALGVGLLAWAGSRVLLSRDHEPWELFRHIDPSSDPQALYEILAKGDSQVSEMHKIANKVKNRKVSLKIEQIAAAADKIFRGFLEDPSDIKRSRDFLNVYLDKSVEIIEKYHRLEQKETDVVEDTLKEVEGLLDTILVTFEDQYTKNLSNDMMDLNASTRALDKRMQHSGI